MKHLSSPAINSIYFLQRIYPLGLNQSENCDNSRHHVHSLHSQNPVLLILQPGGNHISYITLLLIDGVQINNFFVE